MLTLYIFVLSLSFTKRTLWSSSSDPLPAAPCPPKRSGRSCRSSGSLPARALRGLDLIHIVSL